MSCAVCRCRAVPGPGPDATCDARKHRVTRDDRRGAGGRIVYRRFLGHRFAEGERGVPPLAAGAGRVPPPAVWRGAPGRIHVAQQGFLEALPPLMSTLTVLPPPALPAACSLLAFFS